MKEIKLKKPFIIGYGKEKVEYPKGSPGTLIRKKRQHGHIFLVLFMCDKNEIHVPEKGGWV